MTDERKPPYFTETLVEHIVVLGYLEESFPQHHI